MAIGIVPVTTKPKIGLGSKLTMAERVWPSGSLGAEMLRDKGKFWKPVIVFPLSTIGGWLGFADGKAGGVGFGKVGVGTIEPLEFVPVLGVGVVISVGNPTVGVVVVPVVGVVVVPVVVGVGVVTAGVGVVTAGVGVVTAGVGVVTAGVGVVTAGVGVVTAGVGLVVIGLVVDPFVLEGVVPVGLVVVPVVEGVVPVVEGVVPVVEGLVPVVEGVVPVVEGLVPSIMKGFWSTAGIRAVVNLDSSRAFVLTSIKTAKNSPVRLSLMIVLLEFDP